MRKEIDFECPECGHSSMYMAGKFTYRLNFTITEVEYDDYLQEEIVNPGIQCRYLMNVEDASIRCGGCGFVIAKQEKGERGYEEMVEEAIAWLKKHKMIYRMPSLTSRGKTKG